MKVMEKGQVLLGLILIMTVALAIGLSIVQKSLVDVSTSTKVEESSRAFSAAEGGIEKALQLKTNTSVNFSDNLSKADVTDSGLIPCIPGAPACPQKSTDRQAPLEYPLLAKEEVAHVWLSDFNSANNPPPFYFTNNTLDIYWGTPSPTDQAALELSLINYDGTAYKVQKWYLDQKLRDPDNNFDRTADCPPGGKTPPFATKAYQCKKTLTGLPSGLMLIRARLLYNTASQPFAVQAPAGCDISTNPNNGCFIPPQARIFTSLGVSGETQRKVQVFQLLKVVPPYFDYAIFSAGDIKK